MLEHSIPGYVRRRFLERARTGSQRITDAIFHCDVNVLFGCCISASLYELDVDLPIVYFSDATARLINECYPSYMRKSSGYRRACDEVEHRALSRAHTVVFASAWAQRSAVVDYGVLPDRSHVVPMGANVVPEDGEWQQPEIRLPSRSSLRLCIVAADPVRKRLPLAIDTAEHLNRMGYATSLTYVGPEDSAATDSPIVRWAGRLRLSEDADRAIYRRILRESHLMILPSSGEAFGIAPCEAAHFSRPSIVSSAGGLSEVVDHGKTGVVMPMTATARDYAEAIRELADDAGRYLSMCRAARQRAVDVLSWERWGEQMIDIILLCCRWSHAAGTIT